MPSPFVWYNDLSRQFMERDYLLAGQTLEERVEVICSTAERILGKPGFARRFGENLRRGWYSLSTPIWTNFGTDRGSPVSCFGSCIDDCMESILQTQAEVGMMTKVGGGTSAYFGNLRPRGSPIKGNGESFGSVHFMRLFDNLINVVSQGKTRRGNFAAYLPVDHPDILEMLQIRSEGHPMQDISYGVTVPDYWMEEMIAGDERKRDVWARILGARYNTGFPYVVFSDSANRNTVDVYRDKGMRIVGSNLCSEIMLPSTPDESFVCNLSSMNIACYDEWRGTDAVELLVYFLDAVVTEFIEKNRGVPFMGRAVRFAERHRALGVGWIGWHTYLQSRMIPFEGFEAKIANAEVAKEIQSSAWAASAKLAKEYGEPEYLRGYGRRNTTLTAIAPTKSSSFILGQVSEGIEPQRTNYYIKDLQKGKFTVKNPQLEALLRCKGHDTEAVWDSILRNGGSVQHLSCLTEREKRVFKTFAEISPMEVVQQAAQRQKHLDQSQSLNLMIPASVPVKDVNALVIGAWRMGVKSLYYQIGVSAAQEFGRNILACASCEA